MSNMDLVFTPAVTAIQEREGSRRAYAKSDWPAAISDDLAAFIASRDLFTSQPRAATACRPFSTAAGPRVF